MSNDCAIVIKLWKHWGQTTKVQTRSVIRNWPCCGGITGLECTLDGSVTGIRWDDLSLSGSIPDSIGNLENLKWL
jgi:hypothetical protein